MKAAVLRANGELRVEKSFPLKEIKAGECRIKVLAAGVCSSDIYRTYENGAYFYPLVMGHEIAGEIVKTGKEVEGFEVGDRVVVFPLLPCNSCGECKKEEYARCSNYGYYGSRQHGGFAEYLNVNAWNLLKLPEGMSFDFASLAEPVAVAVHAASKISVEKNTRVCLLGAGFIGIALALLLREQYPETEIVVVDRNRHKLRNLEGSSLKITTVVASTSEEQNHFVESHSSSFDIVIESTGAATMYSASIKLAAADCQVLWLSNISSDLNLTKKIVSAVLRKELRILGTWNSKYAGAAKSDWTRALSLISESEILRSLVSERVRLDDLPDAIERLYDHKTGKARNELIKVVMVP